MKFTKMHGCGNDFVIVDGPADMTAARARDLCDRRRGIGADGVLVIGEARGRCWRVTLHNADGSMGESCGNGARCVARYLLDRHGGEELELSFAGGDVVARREGTGIAIAFAPPPSPEPIAVDGVRGYRVSFGNPHVVLFVPDPANADLTALAVAARAALGDANVEVDVAVGMVLGRAAQQERAGPGGHGGGGVGEVGRHDEVADLVHPQPVCAPAQLIGIAPRRQARAA